MMAVDTNPQTQEKISTALISGQMCHMQQLAEHEERGDMRAKTKVYPVIAL